VLTECLLAMLRLRPSTGLSFVLRQLESEEDARVLAAALALGESRLQEAFVPLCDFIARSVSGERRKTGLVALGLLRREEAYEFLLERLRDARPPTSLEALQALTAAKSDDRLRARIESVVDSKREPRLLSEFRRLFGQRP
jgi:HEAT repeat protein